MNGWHIESRAHLGRMFNNYNTILFLSIISVSFIVSLSLSANPFLATATRAGLVFVPVPVLVAGSAGFGLAGPLGVAVVVWLGSIWSSSGDGGSPKGSSVVAFTRARVLSLGIHLLALC